MFIVRETVTAKPGQAGKLSKLFRNVFNDPSVRILTDEVADFNTVIIEMTFNNLSEFESLMDGYRKGQPAPTMVPDAFEQMSNFTEMYYTGKREIFRVVE